MKYSRSFVVSGQFCPYNSCRKAWKHALFWFRSRSAFAHGIFCLQKECFIYKSYYMTHSCIHFSEIPPRCFWNSRKNTQALRIFYLSSTKQNVFFLFVENEDRNLHSQSFVIVTLLSLADCCTSMFAVESKFQVICQSSTYRIFVYFCKLMWSWKARTALKISQPSKPKLNRKIEMSRRIHHSPLPSGITRKSSGKKHNCLSRNRYWENIHQCNANKGTLTPDQRNLQQWREKNFLPCQYR